jgi:hypothetical protein
MARNGDKGAPEGRGGPAKFAGFNPQIESEQYMLIVADNSDLAEFTTMMWTELGLMIEAQGGSFPVTQEEFVKYCATAIKVRVEHTSRPKAHLWSTRTVGMSVDSGWALPVPMMDLLSSIGQVRIGSTEVKVWPFWDSQSDGLLLTVDERDRITRELRAAYTSVNVRFFGEMSKDVEGKPTTMVLVYNPAKEEWVSRQPFDNRDAARSMLVGARSVTKPTRGPNGVEYEVVDVEQVATALAQLPIWVPELRLQRNVVVRYLTEMAQLAAS